tara:strand:- start:258 stop:1592 length:1335 start_codon:yes stop_codon:yes gene_type:complete
MLLNEENIRKLIREALEPIDSSSSQTTQSSKSSDDSDDYSGDDLPDDDKSISAVDKNFRPIVEKIMGLLKGQGFDPILGSAYRSPKSQQDKIDKGYSKTKTIYGYHVALDDQGNKAARAVDLVNRGDGWSSTKAAFDFFEALGKISNSDQFKDKVEWGGNWKQKKKTVGGKEYFIGWDPAHIQTKSVSMSQSAEITKKGVASLKSQGKEAESISETAIRALIREALDPIGRVKKLRAKRKEKSSYDGPLVTDSNGKKYLGDPGVGMSPPGYWQEFRSKLNAHINKVYPELGFKIDNLGVTRDLGAAADAGGNTARVSGSKHGAGLAQDIYMHTKKYGEYTSYKNDNPKLAKDQKLVDAIISFLETSSYSGKVFWGGAFSSGKRSLKKGQLPKDRGILEFHHFEFANKDMPNYFTKYKDELAKLGLKPGQITSTKALGNLYNKLL